MTKETAVSGIRLAPKGEPGACLYNAYNFLTQLSTLYAQAVQHEQRPCDRSVWEELCDSALGDLGEVFNVWETALRAEREGQAVLGDPRLYELVTRSCRRAGALAESLSLWTPMTRWARILQRCERRWQRILGATSDLDPGLAPKLEGAHRASLARDSRLLGLQEKGKIEAARIDDCFDDDLGGSFGGAAGI